MKCSVVALFLFGSGLAFTQQTSAGVSADDQNQEQSNLITVRGCLRSEQGSYILIADKTGIVYALQGVDGKLQGFPRQQVEVTGEAKTGSVRTGIRPEKAGSNPADTVHGVSGIPLQVKDVDKDIRVLANKCKAADVD